MKLGFQGNRYSLIILKIAVYIYIRGGKALYEFIAINLKFPVLRTVTNFMANELAKLEEGIMRFDGLQNYLIENNFDMEVGLFEDGTKIIEKVEVNFDHKSLLGLISPFNSETGLPEVNFHQATSGWDIYNALINFERSGYIQLILAQPNHTRNIFKDFYHFAFINMICNFF